MLSDRYLELIMKFRKVRYSEVNKQSGKNDLF